MFNQMLINFSGMDSTALLTVVCVAVVVLVIVLTGLCLNCKGNSQPSKIKNHLIVNMNSDLLKNIT